MYAFEFGYLKFRVSAPMKAGSQVAGTRLGYDAPNCLPNEICMKANKLIPNDKLEKPPRLGTSSAACDKRA